MLLNATLLRYSPYIAIFSGIAVVLNLLIIKKIGTNYDFWAFGSVAFIYLILLISWLIFNHLTLWIILTYAYILLIMLSLIFVIKKHQQTSLWWKNALRGAYSLLGIVLLVGATVINYFTIDPTVITKRFAGENSFEPQTIVSPIYDDVKYQHSVDIKYGTRYPNSFMDIISINDNELHPVFFYIHGGGFTRGDKILAHPDDPSTADFTYVSFNNMLEEGYNVVTINHAFAPDYLYPVQTYQVSEAMSFLLEHAIEYGIDMNNIVIAGESSGGYLATSFVSAQVNPDYARKIDLVPVLQKEQLKAMVLESALLDPSRAGKTTKTKVVSDYIFQMALGGFLGTSAISSNKEIVEEANLLTYISADFPPTFLTDGNSGTWPDQAQELAEALTEVGVDSEAYIPSLEMGVYGHVYFENVTREATIIFLNKRNDFLSKYV